ncbi:MAG: hypothetical protein A2722_03460 [Candidatus Doudnabacteria bacterium RIFCSPHIGHO2_01_FULL_50_11]|uniref:PpiC domain-containing protein n=1 Tax=Candidatus Doudnabacteria bacterium RIFCSPHIGHO2_01_FULL_50_11 TaxID=1817828 RepID=A0A1F5PIL2_9BACT|nr:MAG: hypothetical protein A2722_03460 [Candidatus Doudnabacteria bacterium RIFCSPHIGHO2_01_FULL_50_11]HLC44523.1 peptidylprolyl isomerase [Patescibacteria group bacterium]
MENSEHPPLETPSSTTTLPWLRVRWQLVVKILLWLVAFFILGVAVFSYGIYRVRWQNPTVSTITKVLPFPAAMVNWRIVSLYEFNSRFDAYKKAITYNQDYDFSDPKNTDDIHKQQDALLTRMIDLKLEEQLARSRGISVSSDEVDRELETIAVQAQVDPSNLDDLVNNIYGWSRQQFIANVVIPQIRERKLQQAVASDVTLNADALARAQDVLQQITAGGDFAKLAEQYSDDPSSKPQGGDLGWNPSGAFVTEFEDAVSRLEIGKTSDLVTTQFGYHIVQVLGRTGEGTADAKTHVRHILIATKPFTDWLAQQTEQSKVWKFPVI